MTDGRRVVELALDELREMSPEVASTFRVHQEYRYANSPGPIHWSIAYQDNPITNPSADVDTPATRVPAQLTIDTDNSAEVVRSLLKSRNMVEDAFGKEISWLPGGEDGTARRSHIRPSRPFDGSEEALATWLATEFLRLRSALRRPLLELGVIVL